MLTRQQDHELRELLMNIVEARTLASKDGRGRPEWQVIENRIPFADICRAAQWLNIKTDYLSDWWQLEKESFLFWVTALDQRIGEGLKGDDHDEA